MSYYPSVIPDLIGNPHLPCNAQPRAILLTRVAPQGSNPTPRMPQFAVIIRYFDT